MVTFRCDDVGADTKLERFKECHELFNKYNQINHIAVICKGLEQNTELIQYIKSQKNIVIQFHCYEHVDASILDAETVAKHLDLGIKILQDTFGITPTIWWPAWNKVSHIMIAESEKRGMIVSSDKVSLSHKENIHTFEFDYLRNAEFIYTKHKQFREK